MQTALFHNFSNQTFTGYWDGKPKTFKPGEKAYMPLFLAEHYAKHLTNQILISRGHHNYTSPKFPKQVPLFMELFDQACIIEEEKPEMTETEMAVDLANKEVPKTVKKAAPVKTKSTEPQIVTPPDADDEDEDEEFEGLKKK